MKSLYLFILGFLSFQAIGQIQPTQSMYYVDGPHAILADSNEALSTNALWYRPQTAGQFPVFFFQPGANGFFSSAIDRHSYDLFMKHLASWGYVVVIVDETGAGLPNGNGFTTVYDWFMQEHANGGWPSLHADTSSIALGGHSNGGVNATNLILNNPNNIDAIVYMASYPSDNFLLPHDVSGYEGHVLSLTGSDDNPVEVLNGFDSFTSKACGVYVNFNNTDHGAFGDYDNQDQPVGSIGRVDATASIRHYLVSFLEYALKADATGEIQLLDQSYSLTSNLSFTTDCIMQTPTEIKESSDSKLTMSSNYESIRFEGDQIYGSISILSIEGKIIQSIVNRKSATINRSSISKGIYVLVATTKEGETVTIKFNI